MIAAHESLLQENKKTEIFSALIAPEEIDKTLAANQAELRRIAQELQAREPRTLLLVSSGASWAALYAGYHHLRTSSRLPSALMYGPELVADRPAWAREPGTVAVLASYSGMTADTVQACGMLGEWGVPRLAITRNGRGPLAQACEYSVAYHSVCLYTSAMANLLWLLAELQELSGETQAAREMKTALDKLPDQMRAVLDKSEALAVAALDQVKGESLFYVLGDGATWGHAYQFGYTNLMEYARVDAACVRTCEWRHGPLEILFRRPTVLMFVGDDGSRPYAEATRDYCRKRGAKTIAFDVRDYFPTHPSLAPFVLHGVTQYLLLHLSTHHGINMDDYLEMHVRPYIAGETYF